MKNGKKTVLKVFFIFFFISLIWGLINFATCDFILWGQTPSFCTSLPISIINLLTIGYKFFISGNDIFFQMPWGTEVPLFLGLFIQISYSLIFALVFINRKIIAEKYSKVLIFLILIVFLYFAWIPASNTPKQFLKIGLGETSYVDNDGSNVYARDPSESIRYSLMWPFVSSNMIQKEMAKDYQESVVRTSLPYKSSLLKSYILQSLVSIFIIAILISFVFFKKSREFEN